MCSLAHYSLTRRWEEYRKLTSSLFLSIQRWKKHIIQVLARQQLRTLHFKSNRECLFPWGKEKASSKQNNTTTKTTKTPETLLSADGKTELIIYWIFFCVSGLFWKQLQKHFFSYFTQKNRVTITTLSLLRKSEIVALAAQGEQQIQS